MELPSSSFDWSYPRTPLIPLRPYDQEPLKSMTFCLDYLKVPERTQEVASALAHNHKSRQTSIYPLDNVSPTQNHPRELLSRRGRCKRMLTAAIHVSSLYVLSGLYYTRWLPPKLLPTYLSLRVMAPHRYVCSLPSTVMPCCP